MPVRAGSAAIRGIAIDHVVARQTGTPMVVVEGAGEMKGVGGAVALRPVVGVVEMHRRLIAAEPAVPGTVRRQVVKKPHHHGLPIAPLQEGDRHATRLPPSLEMIHRPNLVRGLIRPGRMKLRPCRAFSPSKEVADLRKKLFPPLVGEPLAGRAAFHRASIGEEVDVGIRRRIASLVRTEVRVIGESLRRH